MIVIWIKKNEHAVLLLYKFSHCPDSAIYIYLFMYMYFKKVKFHWNINYKHALKNFLVLFKNHVTLRGFLNLKKKCQKIIRIAFLFSKESLKRIDLWWTKNISTEGKVFTPLSLVVRIVILEPGRKFFYIVYNF